MTESAWPESGLRSLLTDRLAGELSDERLAADVVGELDDDLVRLIASATGGDIAGSPLLTYTPDRVPGDEIDSLWVAAFGYRLAPSCGLEAVSVGDRPPPIEAIEPGPTNEALARAAARFLVDHPVPVVAQFEVAEVLGELGVDDVIAVGPDVADDGSVTYLSTSGLFDKGFRLAEAAGLSIEAPGMLCFAHHVGRCALLMKGRVPYAAVPCGVDLPSTYDPDSGQLWTRSATAYVPIDLLGRALEST